MKHFQALIFFLGCLILPGADLFAQENVQSLKAEDFAVLEKKILENVYNAPDSALIYSKKYLESALRSDVDSLIAKGYYFLGVSNYFQGRHYLSNSYYQKALDSEYATGSTSFAERCYNNMGVNYELLGMFPKSFEAYVKSKEMAERNGDSVSIAQSMINLGLLDVVTANYQRGEETLKSALAFFERRKDSLNIALCYQNLSKLYSQQNQFEQARNFGARALEINQAIGNTYGVLELLYNMSFDLFYLGRLDDSEAYLKEADALANGLGVDRIKANIYHQWAKLARQKGQNNLVESYLQAAMKLFREVDNLAGLTDVYLELASHYAQTGDYAMHNKVLSDFRKANKEMQERASSARYDELMALYEHEQHIKIIEEQTQKLANVRKRIFITTVIAVLLLLLAGVLFYSYRETRAYARSLFEKNKQQMLEQNAKQHQHVAEVSNPVQGISIVADLNGEGGRLKDIYDQIVVLMEEEHFYKRTDLSVAQVSDQLATNDKYVSQAINTFSGQNFNAFVNSYRVNEARRLIMKEGHRLKFKDIAEKSGFAHLNTFHKNFKEMTGLTPAMFLEMSKEQSA